MAYAQQYPAPFRSLLALGFVALCLTGCGSSATKEDGTLDLTNNKNVNDAVEAATGPLQDLNLKRQEIPPLLVNAVVAPYARAKVIKCADLVKEISALDEILGPDIQPKSITLAASDGGLGDNIAKLGDVEVPDRMSLVDGVGNIAHDSAMGAIRNQTNILPFRSIIRKITGAERHQKKLIAAYEAGKLRRAYLKGLADVKFGDNCLAKPVVIEAKANIKPKE